MSTNNTRIVLLPTHGDHHSYSHKILDRSVDRDLTIGLWKDFMLIRCKTSTPPSVLFAFPLENNKFGRTCLTLERRGSVASILNTKLFLSRNTSEFEIEILQPEWDAMMSVFGSVVGMLTDPRNSPKEMKFGELTVTRSCRDSITILFMSSQRSSESIQNPIILATDSIYLLPKYIPIIQDAINQSFA